MTNGLGFHFLFLCVFRLFMVFVLHSFFSFLLLFVYVDFAYLHFPQSSFEIFFLCFSFEFLHQVMFDRLKQDDSYAKMVV